RQRFCSEIAIHEISRGSSRSNTWITSPPARSNSFTSFPMPATDTSSAEQAICEREQERAERLIHHSDRGVQYLSIRYTERLAEAGTEPSVGSKGDSYDNAL